MSNLSLTKTSFQEGIWQGVLLGLAHSDAAPTLQAVWRGAPIATPELSRDPQDSAQWIVRIALPETVLGDGVRSILVLSPLHDQPLAVIRVAAGDALDQDLQSEIDQLRAELDLLKSAFRRHCAETT